MIHNSERQEKEKRWAQALQQGDQEIMGLLYDTYAPVLLGLISRIVKDKEIAESVLMQTFLMVWQQKATYNASKMGLLTWMIMLAKETALQSLKGKQFNSVPNGQEIGTFAVPDDQIAPGDGNQFCNLKPEEKASLDLIYLKGYSCAEAAVALGITEEKLLKSLKMAIKHLGTETAS